LFTNNIRKSELEEELILTERAKKSREAFKPLYEKYYNQIFRYIFNKTREKEITADLTSQVFLKALVNIQDYKYMSLPFSAWLYKIATNEVLLFYRKTSKTRYVVIEEGLIAELSDEMYNYDRDILEEKITDCIQGLPIEDIQLIELRFQENKSFKEIGMILNITENNAKVKTYRVLDRLKMKMAKKTLTDEKV
jgi:RNA polymerase sigma-70 factor, ECF subfamily